MADFAVPTADPALAGLSRDALIGLYWQSHPRFLFFKGVPRGACLLDMGAGSGGLAFWREYGAPPRKDIKMYAVDLAPGEFFGRYAGSQVANLDREPLGFEDGFFDAALASHVFEHFRDPAGVLAQLRRRMKPGGRAYLEVPSPASKDLPKRDEFVAHGWPMTISNFFDDATHVETFSPVALRSMGEAAGFGVVGSGAIESPYLADTLIRRGIDAKDAELVTYGYWARTRWAHYAIFEALA